MTLASTCSTWRGNKTADSDDPDSLEDALGSLVRAAQQDLEGASKLGPRLPKDEGELVERAGFISSVLMAPGYCTKDFHVEVADGELRIEAPDFDVVRPLDGGIDSEEVVWGYRNGVLSVRIAK